MGVVVGHLILISAQVNTNRGVPVLEAVTFGVFAEVQRAASSAVGSVRGVWENYFALQRIRGENQQLQQEVSDLRIALQQERALAQQSRTLQALLELRSTAGLRSTAAAVIGSGPDTAFRTITIDKGTENGLQRDMAVLAPAGVVGRVIMASPRAAKVQLIIDRDAAAGVMIERSRVQGVVTGLGATDMLELDYVPSAADVKIGDRVVTSGVDGISPKGFAIGEIQSINRQAGEYRIQIRPAVNFSSLEAVLVALDVPAAELGVADDADEGR
jgi:rod shape-determining protein MreC